jgi:hypothetical protein
MQIPERENRQSNSKVRRPAGELILLILGEARQKDGDESVFRANVSKFETLCFVFTPDFEYELKFKV